MDSIKQLNFNESQGTFLVSDPNIKISYNILAIIPAFSEYSGEIQWTFN